MDEERIDPMEESYIQPIKKIHHDDAVRRRGR
jgi:hypothetical protein